MGEQLYGRVLTVARWIGSLLPPKGDYNGGTGSRHLQAALRTTVKVFRGQLLLSLPSHVLIVAWATSLLLTGRNFLLEI